MHQSIPRGPSWRGRPKGQSVRAGCPKVLRQTLRHTRRGFARVWVETRGQRAIRGGTVSGGIDRRLRQIEPLLPPKSATYILLLCQRRNWPGRETPDATNAVLSLLTCRAAGECQVQGHRRMSDGVSPRATTVLSTSNSRVCTPELLLPRKPPH